MIYRTLCFRQIKFSLAYKLKSKRLKSVTLTEDTGRCKKKKILQKQKVNNYNKTNILASRVKMNFRPFSEIK